MIAKARFLLPFLVAVLGSSAIVASGGCKGDKGSGAKVGDKCEGGTRTCKDGKTSLFCAAGAWQADTCKGPRGCYEDKGASQCDITGNEDGDPCPAVLDGFGACRADHKSRVTCKASKYVTELCKGAEGCTMEQAGVASCDRGAASAGDNCTLEGRQVCSEGGKTFLLCKAGKFVLGQKCPGPNGCKEPGGGLVTCDPNGPFEAGDACHFIAKTCSGDGKAQLECEASKFVQKRECPGPDRCKGFECDSGQATVGEPCVLEKRACSVDGKSLLACKTPKPKKGALGDEVLDPKWTVDKTCKAACTPKDGVLDCQ
jgi:hypothetical protein